MYDIERLNTETRVANSFSALCYKVSSEDPEMDEALKEAIQHSFLDKDLALTDYPADDEFHEVFENAHIAAARKVHKISLDEEQIDTIKDKFGEMMRNNDNDFYFICDAFEEKYRGETVDFHVVSRRLFQDHVNNIKVPTTRNFTQEELDEMDRIHREIEDSYEVNNFGVIVNKTPADLSSISNAGKLKKLEGEQISMFDENVDDFDEYFNKLNEQFDREVAKDFGSGISYDKSVPEYEPERREYTEREKNEELKGNYDKEYDEYASGKSNSGFSAGDDYGFDEFDDGPEF